MPVMFRPHKNVQLVTLMMMHFMRKQIVWTVIKMLREQEGKLWMLTVMVQVQEAILNVPRIMLQVLYQMYRIAYFAIIWATTKAEQSS